VTEDAADPAAQRLLGALSARSSPLEGIRVLDATHVMAGPFCTYQLALLGADVVRVEPLDARDPIRTHGGDAELNRRRMGTSFLAQNAGKRSLGLNLKHPEGRAIFRRLAGRCDVLVENFRPGVLDRLGLGMGTLTSANPRLIYCAISGFGQEGPLRDRPAYDHIIQAIAGMMTVTGTQDSGPMRVGFPLPTMSRDSSPPMPSRPRSSAVSAAARAR
jgi:CoA:oxalate CoA-transferase